MVLFLLGIFGCRISAGVFRVSCRVVSWSPCSLMFRPLTSTSPSVKRSGQLGMSLQNPWSWPYSSVDPQALSFLQSTNHVLASSAISLLVLFWLAQVTQTALKSWIVNLPDKAHPSDFNWVNSCGPANLPALWCNSQSTEQRVLFYCWYPFLPRVSEFNNEDLLDSSGLRVVCRSSGGKSSCLPRSTCIPYTLPGESRDYSLAAGGFVVRTAQQFDHIVLVDCHLV